MNLKVGVKMTCKSIAKVSANFFRVNQTRANHHQAIREQLHELWTQGIVLHNERITVQDYAGWDKLLSNGTHVF